MFANTTKKTYILVVINPSLLGGRRVSYIYMLCFFFAKFTARVAQKEQILSWDSSLSECKSTFQMFSDSWTSFCFWALLNIRRRRGSAGSQPVKAELSEHPWMDYHEVVHIHSRCPDSESKDGDLITPAALIQHFSSGIDWNLTQSSEDTDPHHEVDFLWFWEKYLYDYCLNGHEICCRHELPLRVKCNNKIMTKLWIDLEQKGPEQCLEHC